MIRNSIAIASAERLAEFTVTKETSVGQSVPRLQMSPRSDGIPLSLRVEIGEEDARVIGALKALVRLLWRKEASLRLQEIAGSVSRDGEPT